MNYKGALEVLHKIGGQDLVDAAEKEMARQNQSVPRDKPGRLYFSCMFVWEGSELGADFWIDIDDKFTHEVSNGL